MNDILYYLFGTVQGVFILIAAGILIELLLALLYLLFIMIHKPDIKAEIHAMNKAFKEDKKRLEAEKKQADAEIKRNSKEISEEEEKARRFETEAELMREELVRQGLREEEAKEISGMTLEQLFKLKEKERKDMSPFFIINAVTRKLLIDSEFERRKDVDDFKVPVNKTRNFGVSDVEKYLTSLNEATHVSSKGKSADTYKVSDKSFALLYDLGDGKFRLTLKCGAYFGQRLTQLYPEFFQKAKFPYGMIWFSIDNLTGGCSFELIQLLGYISYNIAKAGY